MKERLEEARDILGGILSRYPHWPVGLVRVHRLIEQAIEQCWDEDDVAILAPDELTEEPRFPAA